MSLLNVWVYSELAMMFPGRSGGISLYANEAWRKYTTLVGPIATFGYWIGWSVVLAIFGNIIGSLIQAQWFSSSTWTAYDGVVHLQLFNFIGIGCIVLVWLFNIFGIRLFAWFTYITGALMIIPLLVLMFGGFVSGHWHSSNVHWALASSQWGGVKIALVWLFIMMWSSNGIEVCATFTPEYKSRNDSTIALRTAGSFSLLVFILLPLGLGGVTGIPGTSAILANSSYVTAMNLIVGHGATDVLLVFLIVAFLLSMSSSTADAGRALYGISKAGLTVKWLGRLNRFHVPGNAMTVDLVVNTCLILFISSNLAILYMSNIGYVLCNIFALSGFLLLRKDRPNWPRPLKLSKLWVANLGFPDALLHNDPRRRRGLAGAERLRFVDRLRDRRRSPRRLHPAVLLPPHRRGQGKHPLARGHAHDARGSRPRRSHASRLDAPGDGRSGARGELSSLGAPRHHKERDEEDSARLRRNRCRKARARARSAGRQGLRLGADRHKRGRGDDRHRPLRRSDRPD